MGNQQQNYGQKILQIETPPFKNFEEELESLSSEFKSQKSQSKQITNKEENIEKMIDNLKNYLNNFKIYIVFMGKTSSGKSTFINALLGQQLLPSRNQSCTSQVVYIGHQNNNIKMNEQIVSLQDVQEKLSKKQENSKMEKVNITTQSYFHQNFSEDLQKRIVFVDTPGFQLSENLEKDYFQHIQQINELVKLDEQSIRIDIWVIDYSTFDSEKKIYQQMIKMAQGSVEQNGSQNQIQQSKIQTEFFVINKYDLRNESQDNSGENVLQDTKKILGSENIFLISASRALHFTIMKYGSQDAQNTFIDLFYEDNRIKMAFTKVKQAKKQCERIIQNNPEYTQFENFKRFQDEISLRIKKSLNHNIFDDLIKEIDIYKFNMKCQNLTEQQKEKLKKLQENLSDKMEEYKAELQNKKKEYVQNLIKNQTNKNDNIQQICEEFLKVLKKLTGQILDRSQQYLDQFKNTVEFDLNVSPISEENISEIKQIFQKIFNKFMKNQFEEQLKKFEMESHNFGIKPHKKSIWDSINLFNCGKQQKYESSLQINKFDFENFQKSLKNQIGQFIESQIQCYEEMQQEIKETLQKIIE